MNPSLATQTRRTLGTACPVDGGDMRILLENAVAVHSCGRCHGSWLSTTVNGHRAAPGPVSVRLAEPSSRKLVCPSCRNVRLKSLKKDGLELDVCPECRGVWFDAGELRHWLMSRQGQGRHASVVSRKGGFTLDVPADAMVEAVSSIIDLCPEISFELAKEIVGTVLGSLLDGL